MKHFLLILTVLSIKAFGQSAADKVKEPITRFFDGMRTGDSALIKGAVSPNALLQTVVNTKDGHTQVRTEDMAQFIQAVTKPHDKVYDERITYDVIRIDADLAIAWTPYKFYVGDQFSHCGVNSFQLVRLDGQWKIQYIIDTRRKDACP